MVWGGEFWLSTSTYYQWLYISLWPLYFLMLNADGFEYKILLADIW